MTTTAPPQTALPSQSAVMAQSREENFPVASILLGRERRHLMAIYGFARLVDDVGDELSGDRNEHLDNLEEQLDAIYAGARPAHPVMATLSGTIDERHLPAEPFRRLIEANRRDQLIKRYESFDQLLDYCRLSATPVGELVLHVFDAATPDRIALSDRICSALQVIEHLQDVGEDYLRGRVYLPQEDLARFACSEDQLTDPLKHAQTRALLAFEATRAHALLDEGAPLARMLSGPRRFAVAGFVAGGRAALRAIQQALRAERGRAPSTKPTKTRLVLELPRAVIGR